MNDALHEVKVPIIGDIKADELRRWKQCFGDARQIGYFTTDLATSIRFFVENARIGPWFVAANRYLRGVSYRGTTMDVRLSTAHANNGGVQIEIIEPDPSQQSVYSEWMARQGCGTLVHHTAWWVKNYTEAFRLAEARGYEAVLHGRATQGGFAYFQHPAMPEFSFEVTELTPERQAKYDRIALAAAQWDGSDPVRSV